MSADESELTSTAFEDLVAKAELVLYPCTITPTRYRGTYEGGRWAAFRRRPEELPEQAFGGDSEALVWWSGVEAPWIGIGNTPAAAFRDLVRRWARLGCPNCGGIGLLPRSQEDWIAWTACPSCNTSGLDAKTKCGYCGRSISADRLATHLNVCEARKEVLRSRYPRDGEAAVPEV
jgi:hypothetical protein